MAKFDPIIEVEDDGLLTPPAGNWSLEKYQLVGGYCNIFTSSMTAKWDRLVYIDLFAGSGRVSLGSGRIILSSPFIAASIPRPFTSYILCERSPDKFDALSARVRRDYGHLNVTLLPGDCNETVDEILKSIPTPGKENKVLAFCFVDPYSLDFSFSTISRLSSRFVDFLILQALHMDGNRNIDRYITEENERIERYLGLPDWRDEFRKNEHAYRANFVHFLATQYQQQMSRLDYINKMRFHQIRSDDRNLPLYYLAFYSRHQLAHGFFHEIEQLVSPQLDFGD